MRQVNPEAKMTGFGKTAFDLDDCLDKALTHLSRLRITYNEGDAVVKRRIVGSMYLKNCALTERLIEQLE
jgi:hypothetical protein